VLEVPTAGDWLQVVLNNTILSALRGLPERNLGAKIPVDKHPDGSAIEADPAFFDVAAA